MRAAAVGLALAILAGADPAPTPPASNTKAINAAYKYLLRGTASKSSAVHHQPHQSSSSLIERRLHALQHPRDGCGCRRALIFDRLKGDGFACKVHWIGVAMMLALQANRTLYVKDTSTFSQYIPSGLACASDSDDNAFGCLFTPLTSCSLEDLMACDKEEKVEADWHARNPSYEPSLTASWAAKRNEHYGVYFGPKRVLHFEEVTYKRSRLKNEMFYFKWHMPWPWLQLGPFYVRSHIQRYLWSLSPAMQSTVDKNPLWHTLRHTKYIAIHIRLTDNINDSMRNFGVDPRKADSLDHCMRIAERIRRTAAPTINTILVATDNKKLIAQIDKRNKRNKNSMDKARAHHSGGSGGGAGWRFVYQAGVPRSNKYAAFDWYKQSSHTLAHSGVLTDIELMRKADFVIGSMTSNVFRLVAELRAAAPGSGHGGGLAQRVFSVDVPWMQKP